MKIMATRKFHQASTDLCLLWKKCRNMAMMSLMVLLVLPALGQTITVNGRVTDESGTGVQRASVTVKGTNNGVTTNDQGYYSIAAPSSGTLVVSSIGFTPIELKINSL